MGELRTQKERTLVSDRIYSKLLKTLDVKFL